MVENGPSPVGGLGGLGGGPSFDQRSYTVTFKNVGGPDLVLTTKPKFQVSPQLRRALD